MNLDLLGAEPPPQPVPRPLSWSAALVSLAVGAAGALVWRRHPVLGFLGASALASNVHAVAAGQREWKDAARRLGKHVVATGGALALPSHPAIGYVGGAVAADLLLDGKGGGLLEEFAHYTGIQEAPQVEVVRAIPVESTKTKALAKAA